MKQDFSTPFTAIQQPPQWLISEVIQNTTSGRE